MAPDQMEPSPWGGERRKRSITQRSARRCVGVLHLPLHGTLIHHAVPGMLGWGEQAWRGWSLQEVCSSLSTGETEAWIRAAEVKSGDPNLHLSDSSRV